MLARLQQALVIGLLGSAAAWSAWFWRADHPLCAVLGATGILFGYVLVLAIEFVLLWSVHDDDPSPRASVPCLMWAWWGEARAALAVFGWRQPFCSHQWPDALPANAQGRRGVLLVHGFFCNRGIWNPWLRRLRAAGVPTVAVNLEPVFGPIEKMVPTLEAAFQQLERYTGLAPVVVVHSMGGLVLRDWWRAHQGSSRVHHAITIATPHQGTWLARLGRAPSAVQMRQHSSWLQMLVRDEVATYAMRFTCFYSHCDNIVFPAACATLPGADNRHLAGVGHVAMIDRPEPWLMLMHWLEAEFPPPFKPRTGDRR